MGVQRWTRIRRKRADTIPVSVTATRCRRHWQWRGRWGFHLNKGVLFGLFFNKRLQVLIAKLQQLNGLLKLGCDDQRLFLSYDLRRGQMHFVRLLANKRGESDRF